MNNSYFVALTLLGLLECPLVTFAFYEYSYSLYFIYLCIYSISLSFMIGSLTNVNDNLS